MRTATNPTLADDEVIVRRSKPIPIPPRTKLQFTEEYDDNSDVNLNRFAPSPEPTGDYEENLSAEKKDKGKKSGLLLAPAKKKEEASLDTRETTPFLSIGSLSPAPATPFLQDDLKRSSRSSDTTEKLTIVKDMEGWNTDRDLSWWTGANRAEKQSKTSDVGLETKSDVGLETKNDSFAFIKQQLLSSQESKTPDYTRIEAFLRNREKNQLSNYEQLKFVMGEYYAQRRKGKARNHCYSCLKFWSPPPTMREKDEAIKAINLFFLGDAEKGIEPGDTRYITADVLRVGLDGKLGQIISLMPGAVEALSQARKIEIKKEEELEREYEARMLENTPMTDTLDIDLGIKMWR